MNKSMQFWKTPCGALLGIALITLALSVRLGAQDYDDPPTRVARLGYVEGSVSFQPAGETDWVEAVRNRPMTTGDQLWSDEGSRAELNLGSSVIRLSEYTGVSFLNLDDHTVQVQLSSGAINVTVRRLRDDDVFEIDTPNLAFTVFQPGRYRIEVSQDGDYTTVTVRTGYGEATGFGQTYDLRVGQVGYFSGTNSLNADVEVVGELDPFDMWAAERDRRYDESRSRQYLSADVVGYEDLDDYGDWRNDPEYGYVWFPNRVEYGWAPYHMGHWAWIDPWGYTWVDDAPWGYAPFHYGRWIFAAGRWGWIAGPPAVEPVYAPALVVFIGGGGGGWGGNIGWFPLGPREVYVPSYPVSAAYMTQINVSNTTVNTTVITNIYNTTIVNRTTTITNITYANRSVPGAVTAVPQAAFTSAQPVARAAVAVSPQQIASAPMTAHVAVNPTPAAVLGSHASTANHVSAPPAAVMNRQVVAKKTPPPPPVSFAAKQQAMARNPGQPVPKQQLAAIRPAAAARPAVKVAPPGKPATPATGHPPAAAARPGQPAPQPNRPGNPSAPNNERPGAAAPMQPARPAPPSQPANRPEMNRPAQPNEPENRPTQPQPNRPEANRPEENRPPAPQPAPRSETNRPEAQPNRPENRPPAAQPEPNRPEPNRNEPAPRPQTPPPAQRPQTPPPAAQKPAPPAQQQKQPTKKTPEEQKREEEKKPSGI